MADVGAIEDGPVLACNSTLIADDQRHDDTGIRLIWQGCQNPVAQPATAIGYDMARRPDEVSQSMIFVGQLPVRAHAAGGTQVLLQQPDFIVKPGWIGVAVRALQT